MELILNNEEQNLLVAILEERHRVCRPGMSPSRGTESYLPST